MGDSWDQAGEQEECRVLLKQAGLDFRDLWDGSQGVVEQRKAAVGRASVEGFWRVLAEHSSWGVRGAAGRPGKRPAMTQGKEGGGSDAVGARSQTVA